MEGEAKVPAPETSQKFQSLFEAELVSDVSFWQKRLLEGSDPNDLAREMGVETGVTIEQILERVREAASTKKPASLLIDGKKEYLTGPWPYSLPPDEYWRKFPPAQNESGFDPLTVMELGKRLGVLPKPRSDTYVFTLDTSRYNADGAEIERVYDITPIKSPLVPPNTYWHQYLSGTDYSSDIMALITVNKRYIPTNTNNPVLNRLILKLQGI